MKYINKHTIKDLYKFLKSPKIYNPRIPNSTKSIIFICKGNICRSPFAEHAANKIASERSLERMTFSSAGLEVTFPSSSPNEAIIVAQKYGVELRTHKSSRITSDKAASCDMIIAMEAWHVKSLIGMFPDMREKIYLLPLFDNSKENNWNYNKNNIIDPYGKSLEYFHECFQRIERCLDKLLSETS